METMKLGSRGSAVKELQQRLGITPADGIFGNKTVTAVRKFQSTHTDAKGRPLAVDGIVGASTWEAICTNSVTTTENECTNSVTTAVSEMSPAHTSNGTSCTKSVTTPDAARTKTVTTKGLKGLGDKLTVNPIHKHITACSKRVPRYLVIHYTAGRSSQRGSAGAVRCIFLSREASADFAVDDTTILQINPDPTRYYCWAVGDKTNYRMRGTDGKLVNNSQCVSIEICCNLKSGTSSHKTNHAGWSFTEAALNNAAALSRAIMQEWGIPTERVIRHYDVTHKTCPGIIGWNPCTIHDPDGTKTNRKSDETEWEKFKKLLVE